MHVNLHTISIFKKAQILVISHGSNPFNTQGLWDEWEGRGGEEKHVKDFVLMSWERTVGGKIEHFY